MISLQFINDILLKIMVLSKFDDLGYKEVFDYLSKYVIINFT